MADRTIVDVLEEALASRRDALSFYMINGLIIDTARQNPKRTAFMKVAMLDGAIANLRGKENLVDGYLMVRIPREVWDDIAGKIEDTEAVYAPYTTQHDEEVAE